MTEKIKITETQLMLADMLLATAIKYLIGEFAKIRDASDEELAIMRIEAEGKFKVSMDKLKTLGN